MSPTNPEIDAARALSHALLTFLATFEDGAVRRWEARRAKEVTRPVVPPAIPTPKSIEAPTMLLNSDEAARQLSICKRTLLKYSAPRGPIPMVKVGARVCYDRKDLEAAVEKLKVRPLPRRS